jgi:hypothetical protein
MLSYKQKHFGKVKGTKWLLYDILFGIKWVIRQVLVYDTVLSIEYRMTGPVSKNIVFFTLKLSTCMVVFNQRPNRVERKTDIPHHHHKVSL